jgi:hypothetical protein
MRWATDPNVRYGGIFLITIGALEDLGSWPGQRITQLGRLFDPYLQRMW